MEGWGREGGRRRGRRRRRGSRGWSGKEREGRQRRWEMGWESESVGERWMAGLYKGGKWRGKVARRRRGVVVARRSENGVRWSEEE